jgi:hypothetical protein
MGQQQEELVNISHHSLDDQFQDLVGPGHLSNGDKDRQHVDDHRKWGPAIMP